MRVTEAQSIAVLTLGLALLAGCHSGRSSSQKISIDVVPPADKGGPDDLELIQGHVAPPRDGQRVVVYSHSDGQWWIQPTRVQPLTKIDAQGRWSAVIHLGTEYAAVLVPASAHPPAKQETLTFGPEIIAHTVVTGAKILPQDRRKRSAEIQVSGLRWVVHGAGSARNGSPHAYDINNVWVDDEHHLHMKMSRMGDQWSCAAVNTVQPVGYGTYEVSLEDLSHLEPSHVFGIFTQSEAGLDHSYHEMDFEASRWGHADSEDAEFTVQPYYIPANLSRLRLPAGPLLFSLEREPDRAKFTVKAENGTPLSHTFTSGVPSSRDDLLHLDLCEFSFGESIKGPAEVVVRDVRILP